MKHIEHNNVGLWEMMNPDLAYARCTGDYQDRLIFIDPITEFIAIVIGCIGDGRNIDFKGR